MYESMIFYKSFYDAIQGLDAELQAEIYNAVFKYGLYGELDELSPIANTVFTLIKPQIDANNKRKENGKKGAEYGKLGGRPKKDNPEETPKEPQKNPIKTPNVNVNANVNVNDNINKGRFTPPTLEEVESYCRERGNNVDPARFIDFYSSKGWMVGKNKMKDWKASVRTWEKGNTGQKTDQNKFNNFQQNNYDFDELEKKLLCN